MFTLTSIQHLLKRNIPVELICSTDSRIHIEANNLGIMIHPVKASGYFHPITAFRVSRLLKNNSYSLVHTQASKDLWLLVPALFLAGIKIPLFLTKQMGSFIVKKDFMHNLLYGQVRKIFAISTAVLNNLIDTISVKKQDIIIIPNGVNINRFDPEKVDCKKVRQEFNITSNEIVIGMLARFTPGKGHEEFLWAAKELNKEYNNLRYFIVGEASMGETKYADSIKRMASKYNLNNLIFSGYRADTPEVIAAFDIFTFPSHSESFGIALVEAMAMKKPAVCSDAEGILDIAINNQTAYLFENKNAFDLKMKLKLLIDSKEIRAEFGDNARNRVIQYFDIEVITDRIVNIYREEINKASG